MTFISLYLIIYLLLTICLLFFEGYKMKLIKSVIDKIKFEGKDAFYWDDDLKGFGLKITATSKRYVIQSRANGRTIRKAIGAATVYTPEQARKEAKKLLGELAKGVDIIKKEKAEKRQNITLKEAYADFKTIRNLGEKTIYDYDRAIETTFKDWQNKSIININRDMIEKRFKEKSKESPSNANLHFRFLRALLNFAMEKYATDGIPLIPSNPCDRLKAFKLWNRIERKDTFIKPAQIKSFFHGLTINDYDKPQIQTAKKQCMFILFTGCREQEAARLRVCDIDLNDCTVTFTHTKNHHKHVLPLGCWLFAFVSELCRGKEKSAYLFPANNKSGHIQDHRKAIKAIAEDCGVAFTLHDLRRTFASIIDHQLGAKFTPYTIKRLLNHIQSDVTAGYIRFGVDDLRQPVQMIEDFILTQAGIIQPEAEAVVIPFEDLAKK